ncbi:DgyrCDS11341 [Dimorphilus gyrociliatus]|uniref:Large ribosomal subunit protein uL10m n=1 Tax=Dimorphilus gyrociliatus TaxID=2664684 RepID=A0A7I8W4X1_9ANNE|nr:DgyrCDS11341 [Dimorphilus gyrociliatus]
MASFRRIQLFSTPWIACRHRSKPNIQKPKTPHEQRRIFEAITAPILQEDILDPKRLCFNVTKVVRESEENLYENFLIQDCRKRFESAKVLLVFQSNSLSKNDLKEIRNTMISKCGKVELKEWDNEILRSALAESKFAALTPLCFSRNVFVFPENESQLSDIIKVTKTLFTIHLLGGVINDTIYTKAGIVDYSQLPTIDIMRAQLLQTLNKLQGQTISNLQYHVSGISSSLKHLSEREDNK